MIVQLLTVVNYIISFALVISVIVFVHEFGHYIVARLCGVRATDFAIGFGKRLFGFTDKYGTEWKICAIPLGGYVKFLGDIDPASLNVSDEEFKPQDSKYLFHTKPLWKKSLIVAAGPFANYLLCFLIFTVLAYSSGILISSNIINKVMPGSVAQKAGMLPQDVIVEVNKQPISSFNDVELLVVSSPGIELNFTIKRGNDLFDLPITPERVSIKNGNKEVVIGRIGVQSGGVTHQELNLLDAANYSFSQIIMISKVTLKAIGQIFQGQRSIDEMEGPLSIAKMSADSIQLGFKAVLWLIAMLSLNIGLLNLLPVPVLDGGHLLFYVIETMVGKKLVVSIQKYAIFIGMCFLIALSLYVLVNDILKF